MQVLRAAPQAQGTLAATQTRQEAAMTAKTKAQRQAESRAAELGRPRREVERAAREADDHARDCGDVTEALERAEIDPDRLRSWVWGPFH